MIEHVYREHTPVLVYRIGLQVDALGYNPNHVQFGSTGTHF